MLSEEIKLQKKLDFLQPDIPCKLLLYDPSFLLIDFHQIHP